MPSKGMKVTKLPPRHDAVVVTRVFLPGGFPVGPASSACNGVENFVHPALRLARPGQPPMTYQRLSRGGIPSAA